MTDRAFCLYTNPSRATIPLIRPHQCDYEGGRIRGVLSIRGGHGEPAAAGSCHVTCCYCGVTYCYCHVTDYMLVYEEDTGNLQQLQQPGAHSKSNKSKLALRSRYEVWRQKFMSNLKKVGLDMEEVNTA